jgi:hypothetical protein
MEEHDRKEMSKHLHLCRKRIAAMPSLEELTASVLASLDVRSHSREAQTEKTNMKNTDQKAEITVLPQPTRVFNLEVHNHHRMVCQLFTWKTETFKLGKWYFSLEINFPNVFGDAELFVCMEQGPLEKSSFAHMSGEWKVILKESGRVVYQSRPFQIEFQSYATNNSVGKYNITSQTPELKKASCVVYQLSIWRFTTSKPRIL